jgi:hypothetical protein
MHSAIAEPPPSLRIDRELLRFEHPDQWKERPGWRERIRLSEHNLARIIGGYHLGRDLWQHCGLCNTEHGRGYVVATTEGLETQIGKDCGLKHLGARFEELERQFTVALEAQDRMKRLRELLVQKGEMLSRAQQAMQDCDRAAAAVADFKHKIEREPTLADVFRKAISADGSVFVDFRVSDDEFEMTRRRYRREVVGRIDGHAAATMKSPKTLIQGSVLPLVHSLTEEMLSRLTSKSLAAKSKEANEATDILIDADAYLALSKRFTARRNWQAFASAFSPDRLKTNDRGRRILQQLIELGTE